ncbi:hypothetical protein D3C72_1248780 [compost metagenome]
MAVEGCHADAGRDMQGARFGKHEWVAADFGAELFGRGQSGLLPRVHQHHQEFFAAIAEHEIAGTARLMHHLGKLAQHLVAAGMAMRIVDGLEVVDVQQQHGKARTLAPGNGDLAADHRRQEAPVQHIGQRIAAALDLGHHVEQAVEQVLDARHQFLQFTHLARHRISLRRLLHHLRQHHVVQSRHDLGDLAQGGRAFKQHRALVLQPQAEFGCG